MDVLKYFETKNKGKYNKHAIITLNKKLRSTPNSFFKGL